MLRDESITKLQLRFYNSRDVSGDSLIEFFEFKLFFKDDKSVLLLTSWSGLGIVGKSGGPTGDPILDLGQFLTNLPRHKSRQSTALNCYLLIS